MIFLDIDVPEYQSMRTQEHKIPELLKTLRGRGTIENNNEYDYSDRLHLSFTINEEKLAKFLKVYARFQTLCIIPMFNKNLKKKIYDSYMQYKKRNLSNMLINIGADENTTEQIVDTAFNTKSDENYSKVINELGYTVNPNMNDCLMVFLESFSYKSIQDSSDGYELDMILWVCNDLTFYNSDEIEFLEDYYKCFSSKRESFKEIDEKIDMLILGGRDEYGKGKVEDNISITFSNSYNEQQTYNPNKEFEKIETPISINIPSKYIAQIEVRAMNNLRRLPIVGKTKGFIQHLGRGEIGITVKLALNQKNALEEKIIHDIKSISLYQQEYITTSSTDFYLFKGVDIKELSMSTNIIEEPSDDVDVTIVTLFFVGSNVNKQELDNDYFELMDRANTTIHIKLFNRFLDKVLSGDKGVEINPDIEEKTGMSSLSDEDIFDKYCEMIISKADIETNVAKNNMTTDMSNASSENYGGGNNYVPNTTLINNSDFKFGTLIKSYKQDNFYAYTQNIGDEDFENKELKEGIDIHNGILIGIGEYFFNGDGVPFDSMYLNSILYRIQRIAYYMKNNYTKGRSREELDEVINTAMGLDNNTQAEFLENIFLKFMIEFFDASKLTDTKQMIAMSVSNVFKIEVLNNFVLLIKNILDDDFQNINLFGNYGFNEKVIVNGRFNNKLIDSIQRNIRICFKTMSDIMTTDSFMNKVKDFMIANYYKEADNTINFIETLEKGIKVEIEKAKERLDKLTQELNSDDHYMFDVVEEILKLQILGCRIKDNNIPSSVNVLSRNKNYDVTTEVKIYLITDSILSLFIADLNYEKSVVGSLAVSSATNFVGPFAVTYIALETYLNEIVASIKQVTNGKTADEFISSSTDDKDVKVLLVREYKYNYDKLIALMNIFKYTFGNDQLENLKKLNNTFIRINSQNKDFQSIHGVRVFNEFETPMSFLKKISNNMNKFKNIFDMSNNDLNSLEEITNDMDIEAMLTNCLDNKKEDGTPTTNNNSINISGNDEIDKLVKQTLSVFSPTSIIANATINKNQTGSIIPATFMQTELLGEFKLLRGLRSATKMLQYQYERIMPDYEVFVIDEKYVEGAMDKGYDYQDKIYSLSNIISINIKKDDVSNLKHAIVRILNTTPHYIGMNTVFESQSIFGDNKLPDVVYSNKFVTQKLIFKSGMMINISIDQSSQFYDFTGKIDSVEITSNIITLKCSSFASELLGESFDMANVYASGLTSVGTKLKNIIRKFGINADKISNSKSNTINNNIIAKDYVTGLLSDDKKSDLVVAGASGILYTAIEKSISTLKHLDCPYNELVLGRNLSKNVNGTKGKFTKNMNDIFAESSETTSHRISENINAVEFDLSFYGIQKVKFTESRGTGTYYSAIYENSGILNSKEGFIMSHSSFIPKTVQEGKESSIKGNDVDSLNNSGSWVSYKVSEPLIFGYCYSYKRNEVKLYDVLNDLALRNPGAYWDVLESGHYGTLFLGRNNYMISRKNKTSSLSREDVDEIVNLSLSIFGDNNLGNNFKNRFLPTEDYVDTLRILSELASFYDGNFSKDQEVYQMLESKSKYQSLVGKDVYRKNFVANKDSYSENVLASNLILAISGYNLISCSIETKEDYINTVDVKYKPGLGDRIDRFLDFITGKSSKIRLKSFEGLPDERVRVKAIDPSLTTNLHTKEQAFEYAQSVMYNELRNYYSGKIVILYQPDIKKNDEVLLIDSRNKINGTVIVKDFEHIIDVEVGAITIITPGMKVTTSSLMTDVYLTGMINRLTYEWLKMDTAKLSKTKIDKINQEAGDMLQSLYTDIFENIKQIPVAFEYTGFNFEFDEQTEKQENKTDKIYLRTDGTKEISESTFDKVYQYRNPNVIVTPRNISSLPFKLYPLVKNGKALIPDEDIYNSVERPFDFVVKLVTALSYFKYNALDISSNFKNVLSLTNDLLNTYDQSKDEMYKKIINTYFKGFTNNTSGGINDKNILIERLLADNYYGQLLNDESKANINPTIWDKQSIVFFNCKRLTVDDTERIKEIAKVLSQFTIVHVVELSGKVGENKFEKGPEFSVVEALRQEMENYTKTLIVKTNKKCNEWTTVMQSRLIPDDEPYGDYDDIGAVFINCGKGLADKVITNKEIFTLTSSKSDSNQVEEDTETPFIKTVSRKLMKYTLIPDVFIPSIFNSYNYDKKINMFVFHNYYGKSLGFESLSYEIRVDLVKKLFDVAKSLNNDKRIILGDFNLVLRDSGDNLTTDTNANNEYYNAFKNNYFKAIKYTTTTYGNKLYDQILLSNSMKRMYDKADVIRFNIDYELEDLSDHYPVYLFFKNKSFKIISEN